MIEIKVLLSIPSVKKDYHLIVQIKQMSDLDLVRVRRDSLCGEALQRGDYGKKMSYRFRGGLHDPRASIRL